MQDIFSENVDPKRDLPRTRTVKNDAGTDYNIKQHDPHGFWKIHAAKGQVPESLAGEYTTAKFATEALNNYLSKKNNKDK